MERARNDDSAWFEPLTELDHTFLIYEAHESPMHVASIGLFDARPLTNATGGLDFESIHELTLSRLDAIPRYRQRVVHTPLRSHPVWIDDDRFELRYHLRHTRLPHPGSERQLKRLAGRIFSQQLDLNKPLWEMWIVEGVEGDRFAVISKVHHCMVDGVAGVELLSRLLSSEPIEKVEPARPWTPRPAPGSIELAAADVRRNLQTPLEVASSLWDVVRDRGHARDRLALRARALGRMVGAAGSPSASTSINQPVGPYRRVDWVGMDLEDVRRIKRRLGGSVNDVVLATAAGAFSRFLRESRGEDVRDLEFKVMAPVSVRADSERGQLGNRVAAWILPVPLDERDPRRRLARITETTTELKTSQQAVAAEALLQITEWTGPALIALGTRLAPYSTPFNLVVTNVPGPQQPLHLLSSRMTDVVPLVPLLGTLSIGVALFSYDGRLTWGLSSDWDSVPDLHDLALALEQSFRELEEAAAAA